MEVREVLITSNRKLWLFSRVRTHVKLFNLESKHTRKKDLPLKCLFIIIFYSFNKFKTIFSQQFHIIPNFVFFCLIPKNKGLLDIFNFKATKLSKIYRHPLRARAPAPACSRVRACMRVRVSRQKIRNSLTGGQKTLLVPLKVPVVTIIQQTIRTSLPQREQILCTQHLAEGIRALTHAKRQEIASSYSVFNQRLKQIYRQSTSICGKFIGKF